MSLDSVKERNVVTALAGTVELPKMAKVRQLLDHSNIPKEEIPGKVREELLGCGMASSIHKGDSIAITCGSRGVANIAITLLVSRLAPFLPIARNRLRFISML